MFLIWVMLDQVIMLLARSGWPTLESYPVPLVGGVWTQVAHQESGVAGLGKAAVVYLISNSRLSQICFNLLLKQKK